MLLISPVTLGVGKLILARLKRMTLDIRERETLIQEQVQGSVENSVVLQAMKSEFWLLDLFATKQERLSGNVRVQTRYMLMTRQFFAVSFEFGYWIAFIWGALGIRDGIITFGVMTAFLQLSKPDATDAELKKALHAACADFVLELPQGLDFSLLERGGGQSEGQAERLAIARGLLCPGNIFLFDEITSALDEATERELYRRLLLEYPQKTMIFVTHRPAILKMCNAVVSDGETCV